MLKTFLLYFLSRFLLQSPRSQTFCFFPRRSTPPPTAAQFARRPRLTAPSDSALLLGRSHRTISPVLPVFQICQSKMRTTLNPTRRVPKSRLCKIRLSQSWKGRWPPPGSGQVCLWRRRPKKHENIHENSNARFFCIIHLYAQCVPNIYICAKIKLTASC